MFSWSMAELYGNPYKTGSPQFALGASCGTVQECLTFLPIRNANIAHFTMKPISELSNDIQRLQAKIRRTLDDIPHILGEESVRLARHQIEREGTIDGGFRPWPKRKTVNLRAFSTSISRGKDGKFAPTKTNLISTDQAKTVGRGLLRVRGNLYNAITYTVSGNMVHVGVDLKTIPYAKIHNEGGDIKITMKMRAFFMAKFRETVNPFWLNMAKHKGTSIKMPKRQFLALTPELENAFEKAIYKYISREIPNLK